MLPKHIIALKKASLLVFIFHCISCDNVPQDEPTNLDFIDEAQKTVIVELIVNDLESLVLNAMINLGLQDPGGTVETHTDVNILSVRGNCAREIDTDDNRVTLNLNSCIDHFDILRSGEIIISYIDAFDEPGNLMEVRLNDYKYENISITGGFSILNTSEASSELKSYDITFPKTFFDFTDDTDDFTFSGSRVIEVFSQSGSLRDPNVLSQVNVTWTIEPEIGDNFTISTIGVLTHRIDCWSDGFYFPRAGMQQINGPNLDLTIDYYKSTCGWELAVTQPDVSTQTFTLQELFMN